jgi:hypothetical protein
MMNLLIFKALGDVSGRPFFSFYRTTKFQDAGAWVAEESLPRTVSRFCGYMLRDGRLGPSRSILSFPTKC